jgi:SAM-dependent methyltransferase
VSRQFDGLAQAYARARPGYPPGALRWILEEALADAGPAHPLRVLDAGFGTGIASRGLLAAAATFRPPLDVRIEGVEPGEDMRARALADGPRVAAIHAVRAEATGLPAHAWDLVMAAQAFHWFEPSAALAEFHRLLRPGGVVALLWNLRQEGTDAFTDAYNRVVDPSARLDPLQSARRAELAWPLRASPLFRGLRERAFDNPQALDEDGLVARACSASYFPRADPERARALAALREAFARHARARPDGTRVAVLHHTCQVTLANA